MELKIKDNCILCSKKFDWNEIIVWKLPENIWFCRTCMEKFNDPIEYEWIDTWMVVKYEPWIILENKDKIE
jgi:hypothetical protein